MNILPYYVEETLKDKPFLVQLKRNNLESLPFPGITFSQVDKMISEITNSNPIGLTNDFGGWQDSSYLYSNPDHRHTMCSNSSFIYYCFKNLLDASKFSETINKKFNVTTVVTHGA